MRTVVLGARGQLGSELCRQLGSDAIGLGHDQVDLANGPVLTARLLEACPDVVINAAAFTDVERAEQDRTQCHAINAEAVSCVAAACERLKCTLVHISTDYVFGADRDRCVPYCESDPTGPVSVYGASKVMGERFAMRCPSHLVVRSCGLYGHLPRPRRSRNFVETMLRLASEQNVVRVVNDQVCTPTYVPELAEAMLFLIASNARGLFHIVSQGATTWHDFAEHIFRLSHVSVQLEPICSTDYASKASRPRYSVLSTARYDSLSGPRLSHWKQALKCYLDARA